MRVDSAVREPSIDQASPMSQSILTKISSVSSSGKINSKDRRLTGEKSAETALGVLTERIYTVLGQG